ncbi:MAG: fluoride efflux transporter CrcB [Rhodospirillales bacterium]
MNYLIVFLGAGIGGALRHGVNLGAYRYIGPGLGYGTIIVNIVGSFAMGAIIAYFAFKGDAPQQWRLFLTTGILGGFTTFSAFSLDAALYYERGEIGSAVLYVAASVALSIAALFAGLFLVRQLA